MVTKKTQQKNNLITLLLNEAVLNICNTLIWYLNCTNAIAENKWTIAYNSI